MDVIMLGFLLEILPTRYYLKTLYYLETLLLGLKAALLALLLHPIVCSHTASAEGYVTTFFSKDFVREGVFAASRKSVVPEGLPRRLRPRLNKPRQQSASEVSRSGQQHAVSLRSLTHQVQPEVFVDGARHSWYSEWDVRSGQQ